MKVKSNNKPNKIWIQNINKGIATVRLRNNIIEVQKPIGDSDGQTETGYEYDEVIITLSNRKDLEQYVLSNFEQLFLTALNKLKEDRLKEIEYSYKTDLTSGVVSSLVGLDDENIVFDYETNDQINYSKRANTLSLNPDKTSFEIGTRSHGAITMTRQEFLQFMDDSERHEMDLYKKLVDLRIKLKDAKNIDEIDAITWK